VDLGQEVAGGNWSSKVRAVLSLVPAAWGVVKLAAYVRREKIEVLHTTDRPRDAVVCVLLARVMPVRSVVHVHVGFNTDWMRRSLQWAIRNADAVVAISSFVADTLAEAGWERSDVDVVLNGIDVDAWTPRLGRDSLRQALGVEGATPVVLTACRLFRAKGVSELVQAVHDLSDDVPDLVLLVAGREMEPGYADELAAQARTWGIEERVRLLGQRDDVAALMAAADVFAMPSDLEPFGLVFAEAGAMELPVVALRNGGTVEVVEDEVTGLLSEPGDRVALAENLRTVVLDGDRRALLGANGRRRVSSRFTTRLMAESTASVLRRVARPDSRAE
jgi:glycosyltransferase involved in cell wall biosynthesis